ncbi:FG-GAP-like repeat-containing protein [Rhodopirellula sp. JC740]|uniref:FG-GAP-like repeat-containing protein n=1 Tax=Rhodopirellula halodulae TaxID=2894198 RepID=A0ABS8NE94_9BACT|nr:FG-GAP-like repeat-containing protein [Rhodopirellula sp. JC740]MCC9641158.1 FG-GAP-like repeat-containing protein [Rhodopirellula sp. JC740]
MMFRVLGVISLLVPLVGGCGRSENHKSQTPLQSKDAAIPPAGFTDGEVDQASAHERSRMDERLVERVRPQVQAFCTACHVMPSPEGAPKHEWPRVVDQMYMTYKDSGRTDLVVPDRTETVKFFQLQAPETKGLPLKQQEFPPTDTQWLTRGVDLGTSRPPGISHLQWIESGLADAPALVACDVNTGAVFATWPSKNTSQEEREPKRLATLFQPVHTEPCDLNDDGRLDLVVADVGEFNAADSDLGQVFALIQDEPESGETVGTMQRVVLADGLGRVAEVQPGDFDGDGDIDLLVAVFGWQKTGGIVLLRRDASVEISKGSRAFSKEVIDERAGPVNVPVIDLNGDGHLDFVALVSQEHESVEAFFNDGDGKFENVVLYNAPDPSYGSTGIELVDLDGDGDVDVLYSNGDSFDRGPKRHHTVQWLENTFDDQTDWPREPVKKEGQPSRAEFVHHSLAKMPGVLRAQAGDFDGDGDLDIAAGALLATPTIQRWRGSQSPSILLLRQNGEQQFDGEIIEVDFQQHLTLEVADVDGDGTDEFAIGNFFRDGESDDPHMTWWKHPGMNSQE